MWIANYLYEERYMNGDFNHKCAYKPCEGCGFPFWIQKRRRFHNNSCANTVRKSKGDQAKYQACHERVWRKYGKASERICKCGQQAQHWANLTGNYPDTEDYEAMCIPCHTAYDQGRKTVSQPSETLV